MLKNKKIIYLVSSLDKGGAESHLATLAEEIKKKNYKILVVYFKGNGYWEKHLKKKKIQVIKIPINNFLDFLFKFFLLNKIIKKFSPSIVHCNLSLAEIYGFLLKKLSNLDFKLIVTKHLDSFFLEASRGKDSKFKGIFIENLVLNEAHKIIFISDAVKKYFLNNTKINIDKKKCRVIYYGLNKKSYQKYSQKNINNLKKKLNINDKCLIIGCVARHVEQKSLDFLINSFNLISKKNYNLKLIIVGSGPLTEDLKKLSKSLRIDQKILWIPHFEKISKIISIFDICCLTSHYEGLGLFLLESMLLKKPILASKVAAIPEVVSHNLNGFLFKLNSFTSYEKYFNKLKQKKLRIRFGKQGYKILLSKFELNKMIKNFLYIYEQE